MTTGKALDGKPYAGHPHVRFDEGEVASAATPRRGSLLYKYWVGCWKKYATFSGRARRKEYWMFILFNMLVAFGVNIVDAVLGMEGLLGGLYSLAVFLPAWAVFTRRMHDIGKSGWWWLLALVPVVGAIVLLVFMCKDSQPGDNAYGPNPKGV